MDKERAQFILQSFRPDGSDAQDPGFKEALELAIEDRELGEWLAAERAQDAEFAAHLSGIDIPEDLREAIFDVFNDQVDQPAAFDRDFVTGLASLEVPPGLRSKILSAMEVEQKVVEMDAAPKRGFLKTVIWSASVAAVFMAMLVVTFFFAGAGGNALAGNTVTEVEYSAIDMLNSQLFALDLENDRQGVLVNFLQERNLPTPKALPARLRETRGVGCKRLEIGEGGHQASLICYLKDGQVVYLIVMDRDGLGDSVLGTYDTAHDACRLCTRTQWAVTNWESEDQAYILLSQMKPEEMAELF